VEFGHAELHDGAADQVDPRVESLDSTPLDGSADHGDVCCAFMKRRGDRVARRDPEPDRRLRYLECLGDAVLDELVTAAVVVIDGADHVGLGQV